MESFINLQTNKKFRKELQTMNAQIKEAGSFWYLHPIFIKYWKFNKNCTTWFMSNKNLFFPFINNFKCEETIINAEQSSKSRKKCKKPGKSQQKRVNYIEYSSHLTNKLKRKDSFNSLTHRQRISVEPTLDFNVEYFKEPEKLELAIDNTWIEYTKIHQLHAKERDIEKTNIHNKIENYKKQNKKLEFPEPDFVDIKEIDHHYTNFKPSCQTPKYKPNELRTKHHVQLYGEDAPTISYMETALQNTFEEICQKNNPTLWPIIPFNLN